jgi:adenylosuccinate synthase
MIRSGKVTFVVDGLWGSCGKGKVAAWLAGVWDARTLSSCNGPNAGHTVVVNGKKHVFKQLPSGVVTKPNATVFIGAGAVVDPDRLLEEMSWFPNTPVNLHSRAAIVREDHRHAERNAASLRYIASTMQGGGRALADKIMRVGRSVVEDSYWDMPPIVCMPKAFRDDMIRRIEKWGMLHEVAQGTHLSIDHGNDWPHVTSRNCTVSAALDQLGLPPSYAGDVVLVVRSYPIRVGDLVEDGLTVGRSGGVFQDHEETTWDTIAEDSGMPEAERVALKERELTTVTKRLRRVFTPSMDAIAEAVSINGATSIVLTFAEYFDWTIANTRNASASQKVRGMCEVIERYVRKQTGRNVNICAVGTGPDVVDMEWPWGF